LSLVVVGCVLGLIVIIIVGGNYGVVNGDILVQVWVVEALVLLVFKSLLVQ
jgi:hypothetical protein